MESLEISQNEYKLKTHRDLEMSEMMLNDY